MTAKKIVALLIFCFSLSLAQAQPDKEAAFKKSCTKLLQAVSQKNLILINSLIQSEYGMYILYRPGAMDSYQHVEKLDGNYPFILANQTIAKTDLKKFTLKYGNLPKYNCERFVWNKKGYLIDSLKHFSPISEIVAFRIKYDQLMIGKTEDIRIHFMEDNSRKIVFTGSKGNGFIFYMMYMNGQWYLSMIDLVTTDCSA